MSHSAKKEFSGASLLFGLSAVWVLSLVALLSGFTSWMGMKMKSWLESSGFQWSQEWSERSPFNLAILLLSSALMIISLREVSCWSRRILFLLGALAVSLAALPVFALWDIFWNPSLVLCGIFAAWTLISLWIRPVTNS